MVLDYGDEASLAYIAEHADEIGALLMNRCKVATQNYSPRPSCKKPAPSAPSTT